MNSPVHIKNYFLVQGDKLVQVPGPGIQRVVRQMIKQSRPTRVPKKKRSSH